MSYETKGENYYLNNLKNTTDQRAILEVNSKNTVVGDLKISNALIEKLIGVEELADVLGFAPQTIRNWVALRKVPHVRIGGCTKFRRKSIEAWLERKEFKPCP
ncbi:MAG: helix-turn-helix domain-containing protein [Bdellovibrionia bacterium]